MKTLNDGVKALTSTHAQNRAQWAKKLSALRVMLKTPETFPTSAVALRTGDTSEWKSLEMMYPVIAELRLEYAAGQARHKYSGSLMKAITEMQALEKSFQEAWDRAEKQFNGPLDLGPKIAKERMLTSITLSVPTANFTETVNVPADLGKQFLRELDAVQHIDLAMVFDTGNLKRRFLGNEWIAVKPAFVVAGGKAGWTITETPAGRSVTPYTFDVGAKRFCQGLRGEVRHLQRGERPTVSWKIKKKSEGK